ncbi:MULTISPECIES: hypothetical protein [unclassified Mesorhizobium]|uniref:hypothetical protein n=1 Tax=unclassified Mesorhizobium TaxID=325217 RepID=UPI000FCA1872|nr:MULTISPECIES: hypothetical protein [unclassified Mesorhizobium]RUU59017.1 hypothetical protein EOC99_23345 [Mesorhizobium sp. M7A.T.Ca.TU.009.01.1.1]RUU81527.1 hypothetical protein EOD03_17285 [Mesorhizobium sp. M7A.T.Ca.TU.009.01.1.2]RUT88112.1 hypothetical protein EOD14_07870 [Mesorhizobium sp. M7A.T.Ca.US.000.02.1.1]RUT91881.1 hypothetical protein EOD15_12955 [Mesorhizobium sp. M7A.T.Ca.US.000.02.2.1]RUU01008.1 hypothetical protein EOD12_17460 [Mesorhizobium sp. M7A.T.Ca.TU.009.02.1.1]
MTDVAFKESEHHPASFKQRRETLGLPLDVVAGKAGISEDALEALEATPPGSGTYDSQGAFSVEQALSGLEK